MPRIDPGHRETERILKELEQRITKEYAQAEKEITAKLDDYMRRFKIKDELKAKAVQNGQITLAEYKQWRVGQIAVGKRWEEMRDTIAQDLTNTAKIARSITNGYMPEVYAINHNYGTFQAEMVSGMNTSYTLYDRQTVERLFKDNNTLYHGPGKKVSKNITEGKQLAWDKKQIQSVITQGLLQGESIGDIATRLAKKVGDSDRKASIRNARTITTGVQNAGRVDSYKRAEDMGIELEQEWIATLDGRTRHEHRLLDGQRVKVGEKFKVEEYEIEYPGDPTAEPEMLYNCRCTLIAALAGHERDRSMRILDSELEEKTYEEWKNSKNIYSDSITKQDDIAARMRAIYNAEYRKYADGNDTPPDDGNDNTSKTIEKADNTVSKFADKLRIKYNTPKLMDEELTTKEIIDKIAGADKTDGSCASAAYTYAANKAGIDTRDFRGGESQSLFSSRSTIAEIIQFDGVDGHTVNEINDYKAAKELFIHVKEGKEYILAIGNHAAVVRKVKDNFEYLELQSKDNNGYKALNDEALKSRFKCKRSRSLHGMKYGLDSSIIEIESLGASNDFRGIIGYINTDKDKQKKGDGGGIK